MSDHPVQITFEKAIEKTVEKARADERASFKAEVIEAIDNVHNPCQAVSTPAFMRIRADIKKSIEEL